MHNQDRLLRYLEIVMMHSDFPWVPDNGGDRVTLLQRLGDQVLSSLSCSAQYSDLHPQTQHRQLNQTLTSRTLTRKFPPCLYI